MSIDFDEVIDRHGTGSLKYDCAESRGRSPDLLPLWVADMDLRAPQSVLDALVERATHGIFGYTEPDDAFFAALTEWWETRHGWYIDRGWCTITPGVVYALAVAVRAYTEPGDAVLVQQPVYYPFSEVVEDNGRRLVNAPLSYNRQAGRYAVDLEAFEHTIECGEVRLFLLCNPHNPVGRCWTPEELAAMGRICLAHGVTIVSDEIHADFARTGHRHTPLASLSEELAQQSVTCTSASKTFNLAGLQTSTIVIPNRRLRARFRRVNAANGYSQANAMGLAATEAAYRTGGPWLDELKAYLDGNLAALKEELAGTSLRVIEPESTYLIWVDCRELGLTDTDLTRLVEDEAGLWLDMGDVFGPAGSGFVRINIACPRSMVREASRRLAQACSQAPIGPTGSSVRTPAIGKSET